MKVYWKKNNLWWRYAVQRLTSFSTQLSHSHQCGSLWGGQKWSAPVSSGEATITLRVWGYSHNIKNCVKCWKVTPFFLHTLPPRAFPPWLTLFTLCNCTCLMEVNTQVRLIQQDVLLHVEQQPCSKFCGCDNDTNKY